MTNQEGALAQIYVPALHRELVRAPIPAAVLFLDPGLPQTASAHGLFHPPSYPFPPEKAARVLDELLTVGEALDVASTVAGEATLKAVTSLSMREKTDLAKFAAPVAVENDSAGQDAKIASHKVLLLAWDLETRLAEIAVLQQEVAQAVKPLTANLHGFDVEDTATRDFIRSIPDIFPESLADLPENIEPDWRLTLSAIAAFTPKDAFFITRHAGIYAMLLEMDLLSPLSEDTAEKLTGWSKKDLSQMLRAKAPLWRVLGRSREPKNAPWLLDPREIIVCPA